mmetsp:Transcript_14517/g.20489  ORF Transcript_14517/g.20489 Transcript_14517/m.20489 type:complete len:655 (+) Transcript_14517:185-2149(+)
MARKKKNNKKKKSTQQKPKQEEPKVQEPTAPAATESIENSTNENHETTKAESSSNGLPPLAPTTTTTTTSTSATTIFSANRIEDSLGDGEDPMISKTPDTVERTMSNVVSDVENAAEALENFLQEGLDGLTGDQDNQGPTLPDGDDSLASDIQRMEDAEASLTRELIGVKPSSAPTAEISIVPNKASDFNGSLLDVEDSYFDEKINLEQPVTVDQIDDDDKAAERAEEMIEDDTDNDTEPPPPEFPTDDEDLELAALASDSHDELEALAGSPISAEPSAKEEQVVEIIEETRSSDGSPKNATGATHEPNPKLQAEEEPEKEEEPTDEPELENVVLEDEKEQVAKAEATGEPTSEVVSAANENDETKDEEEIVAKDEDEVSSDAQTTVTSNAAQAKITEAEALAFMVARLRTELGAEAAGVSDDNLYKFIYWKKDVIRATKRFRAHVEWRHNFPSFFDEIPLQVSHDAILFRIAQSGLLVAPEEMVTKTGSPVLVGQLDKNDMSADARTPNDIARMVFYALDRMLEREAAQAHGITILLDMSGVCGKNFDHKIPKLLAKCGGCFPIRINALYCLSTPWWLKNVCKAHFVPELRRRVHFIKNVSEIHDVIDKEKFLTTHGGEIEFDAYSWVSTQMQRESTGEVGSLKNCVVTPSSI